jgi:hypothetical protein
LGYQPKLASAQSIIKVQDKASHCFVSVISSESSFGHHGNAR